MMIPNWSSAEMALLRSNFMHTLAVLSVAFMLGTAIGLERQWRQRTAGLRTNVLVALGAAAFAELGFRLLGAEGATRIISYVVSGIGFLGAGVILKDGTNIRGLNTAATLWCSAAIGAFAGSGLLAEAVSLTVLVLGGNTVLRPIVNWIDRRPIVSNLTEASYRVHALCDPQGVSAVRDLIDAALAEFHYPIREVETVSENEELVGLTATLLPTTADQFLLDQVVSKLETSSLVKSATWTVEAAE
ncbi:MAG: MgtC/SapB family protein [Beijerinckiaceae bacterium]|nr:MgtC/SapB family protein [Beijerinckiaceae bacterium]